MNLPQISPMKYLNTKKIVIIDHFFLHIYIYIYIYILWFLSDQIITKLLLLLHTSLVTLFCIITFSLLTKNDAVNLTPAFILSSLKEQNTDRISMNHTEK